MSAVSAVPDVSARPSAETKPWEQNKWTKIPGKLKQVDIYGNTVCGVNRNDHIYCKEDVTGSNWKKVPGGLKHVSVSNEHLYGVNEKGDIYYSPN